MLRFSALFVLLVCWAGGAFAHPMSGETPLAEIPYNVDYEGWITVDVMVNGAGPYKFIVDTGATVTAVFENLSVRQNFTPVNRPPIRILGLTAAQRLPAFSVGDISIAGRTLDDHVGVILPDWEPPRQTPQGVLGLDFLTQYTVLVDADARLIRLYDPALPPNERDRGWSHTSLTKDGFGQDSGFLYRIRTTMNGRRIPCIIDLGASGTLLNYSALRRLLSGFYVNQSRDTGFTTGSRLHDIFDNTEKARLARISRVGIAAARWRDQTFVVFDAPIFQELGVGRTPFCLVGSDLMLRNNFMFDFAREQLFIGPQARYRPADTG